MNRPGQPQPETPAPLGQAWTEERTRVAVGRNITVSGKLVFQEPVRIEGTFRGEVVSSELVVIAPDAVIEGRIRAPRILVQGSIQGAIEGGGKVVLDNRCRFTGSIEAAVLTVREGAHFEGDVRMPSGFGGQPGPG